VVFVSIGWPGRDEVGGVSRHGFRLATELAPLVDLTIVTSAGGSPTPVPGAELVLLRDWPTRLGHYYRFPLDVRRFVRSRRPDIVHAFGDDWALPRGPFGWVRTFHGSSWSEARASRPLRAANHLVLAALEQLVRFRADVRVAVAPESQRMFGTQYLMAPISPLAITGERRPTAHPSVAFVGAWGSRKRGRLAAEAVARARAELGVEVGLTVFGNEADRSEWPDWVEFVSDATDAELQARVRDSWVLIAPSSYEGFGIPVFEALALGTPVVASPTPGSEYLAGRFASPEALRLAGDAELGTALIARLREGPLLSGATAARLQEVSATMLDEASARFLVERIYRRALGRRRRRTDPLGYARRENDDRG